MLVETTIRPRPPYSLVLSARLRSDPTRRLRDGEAVSLVARRERERDGALDQAIQIDSRYVPETAHPISQAQPLDLTVNEILRLSPSPGEDEDHLAIRCRERGERAKQRDVILVGVGDGRIQEVA